MRVAGACIVFFEINQRCKLRSSSLHCPPLGAANLVNGDHTHPPSRLCLERGKMIVPDAICILSSTRWHHVDLSLLGIDQRDIISLRISVHSFRSNWGKLIVPAVICILGTKCASSDSACGTHPYSLINSFYSYSFIWIKVECIFLQINLRNQVNFFQLLIFEGQSKLLQL